MGSGEVTAVDPDDWRLQGQEQWCRGLVFRWSHWRPTPSITYNPDGTTSPSVWDHDHCEFCWREFCDADHDSGDGSRALMEGYAARGPAGCLADQQRDDYHWVCPTCFDDFKEYFGWALSGPGRST